MAIDSKAAGATDTAPRDGFLPGPRLSVPATGEGELSGLRFAVKDIIDVEGSVTGAGNPHWAALRQPAAATAPVVARLLSAGASLCGKTITDELAFSLIGHNMHYGAPPNPASPDRYAGGSSSGSASVVAAGLADFALGTDTAGSVRVPASNCGLFGIRTTRGALDMNGIVPLAPSFDVPGWLAADPDVCRRVGHVLLPAAGRSRLASVVVLRRAFDLLPDSLASPCRTALERLPAGWRVIHAFLEWPAMPAGPAEAFRALQAAEAWRQHGVWVAQAPEVAMAADVRARFLAGREFDQGTLRAASDLRNLVRQFFGELFRTYGAAIVPTVARPALPRDSDEAEKLEYRAGIVQLTCLASLAGLPEVTVPLVDDDWRAGISLIGPRGSDLALLEAAEALFRAGRRAG